MFKLIIADDERIIRQTISSSINWNNYDIEICGLASNGIEAYDMILDESPDIVLTDIRMPLMNGLDLIEKVSHTSLHTHFIILSGYGEFEYAKTAMKYGVRHYLLKPCSKEQITEAVLSCCKDCVNTVLSDTIPDSHFSMQCNMYHNIISNIINDRISQNMSYEMIFSTYSPYLDFDRTPYRLFSVYYLEHDFLSLFLENLKKYMQTSMSACIMYGIYVKNSLLLFCKKIPVDYTDFESWIKSFFTTGMSTKLELICTDYSCLKELLMYTLEKVKRFSTIYYINNFHAAYTCNYKNIICSVEDLLDKTQQGSASSLNQITEILNRIIDITFLKQLVSSILIKTYTKQHSVSSASLTELLIQINNAFEPDELRRIAVESLNALLKSSIEHSDKTLTQQIYDYVSSNLCDSTLTLKSISENYLYMNVDYVSKKFHKESGQKFSQFLTQMRINKAKEILTANPDASITMVAEQVGCSNNPQYFSKLFKTQTGMTPSAYIKNMQKIP